VVTVTAVRGAERRALAGAFAGLLDYPHVPGGAAARSVAETLVGGDQEARALLEAFGEIVASTPLGVLQEAYTRVFDLDTMTRAEPTCYPYVGHYLFEENHTRGAFILGLRKRYRQHGFEDDSDVADHLLVLLRFLAVCEDDATAEDLITDAILPALRLMGVAAQGDADAGNALRDAHLGVLRALELVLGKGREVTMVTPEERELEREWYRDGDSLGISRDRCGR